jgi:hypothetical protein
MDKLCPIYKYEMRKVCKKCVFVADVSIPTCKINLALDKILKDEI